MDRYGIDKSVVCSIATKPSQFRSILSWSATLSQERLVPFLSIHPAAPDCLEQIELIKQAGFKGIKMHPYYQNFFMDEARLTPIYRKISELGLVLLMHTGYDIAFPRTRRADPARVLKTHLDFPELKLVASHLGAWDQWREVSRVMAGKPIYMDISYALEFLDVDAAKEIMLKHPSDFLLFATDSPWSDQGATLKLIQRLNLGSALEEKILYNNAISLLNSYNNGR